MIILLLVVLCLTTAKSSSLPPVTVITHLPGLDGPLSSKWLSGFADAGKAPNGHDMFYHFVLQEAEEEPEKKPLVLWSNGGPGASSMFGLLVELGSYKLNSLSIIDPMFNKTGIPQLIRNPYAWTRLANVLVIDWPAPVGYSYCQPPGQSGDGHSCGAWNDSTAATAEFRALISVLDQLPQLKSKELWLTGESYAGVYIPMLADQVLSDGRLRLRGVAVGDGCMGTKQLCGGSSNGPYWSLFFFYGHGQISILAWEELISVCSVEALKSGIGMSKECRRLVQEVTKNVGGYFAYNLYDHCNNTGVFYSSSSSMRSIVKKKRYLAPTLPNNNNPDFFVRMGYACPLTAWRLWLNHTAVKAALGVAKDANFVTGDNGADFNYTLTEPDVLPIYKRLIDANVRVMLYNADADPSINSFIVQEKLTKFTRAEGISVIEAWRPWTMAGNSIVAGYVTTYEKNLYYVTGRGSGHMLPEYIPEAAFYMLFAFMNPNGVNFPKYQI